MRMALMKYQRHWLLGLIAVATLFFSYRLVAGLQHLLHEQDAPKPATKSLRAEQAADFSDLFGKGAALSQASFKLQGLFAQPDPQAGSAIIEAVGQASRLYAVGETLPNGAKLIAVYNDEVVLDEAGEKTRLVLPTRHF